MIKSEGANNNKNNATLADTFINRNTTRHSMKTAPGDKQLAR